MSAAAPALVELRGVSKRFVKGLDFAARIARRLGAKAAASTVHALDDVSLAVHGREVVGLVGESGCGKSTLGRIVSRILHPTEGERLWKGRRYEEFEAPGERAERLAVQMIFQDPYASLNPRMRIVDIVGEAPVVHGLIKAAERADYVAEVLGRVGMDASLMRRFRTSLQRASRIGIARALAVRPRSSSARGGRHARRLDQAQCWASSSACAGARAHVPVHQPDLGVIRPSPTASW
jgi:peptide/nickel transport system ATP-binding protein